MVNHLCVPLTMSFKISVTFVFLIAVIHQLNLTKCDKCDQKNPQIQEQACTHTKTFWTHYWSASSLKLVYYSFPFWLGHTLPISNVCEWGIPIIGHKKNYCHSQVNIVGPWHIKHIWMHINNFKPICQCHILSALVQHFHVVVIYDRYICIKCWIIYNWIILMQSF